MRDEVKWLVAWSFVSALMLVFALFVNAPLPIVLTATATLFGIALAVRFTLMRPYDDPEHVAEPRVLADSSVPTVLVAVGVAVLPFSLYAGWWLALISLLLVAGGAAGVARELAAGRRGERQAVHEGGEPAEARRGGAG